VLEQESMAAIAARAAANVWGCSVFIKLLARFKASQRVVRACHWLAASRDVIQQCVRILWVRKKVKVHAVTLAPIRSATCNWCWPENNYGKGCRAGGTPSLRSNITTQCSSNF